jgi:hypothetical protein
MENKVKVPRAGSVDQLYKVKFNIMEFERTWKACFGKPQLGGTWLIYGNSGNGKTSLSMQLSKYMTQFGKVLYNSFEEGKSLSFQNTLRLNRMEQVKSKFNWLGGEEISVLIERLKMRNSPDIIIIDSVQHALLNKTEYRFLKKKFPKKLFIYTSHAKGKEPKGEVADSIYYDADLKIRVEGFRAFVEGRLNKSEGKVFDIYPEKSKNYWREVD